MNQADNTPSLRELLAAAVAIPVGTITVAVKPMGWMQFCNALDHLSDALSALPIAMAGYDTMAREDRVAAWAGVLLAHRQRLAAFAATASGLDQAEIEQLQPAHFADLLIGLFELNADFFVRSLPPLMQRLAGRLPELKAKLQGLKDQAEALSSSAASTTSSSA